LNEKTAAMLSSLSCVDVYFRSESVFCVVLKKWPLNGTEREREIENKARTKQTGRKEKGGIKWERREEEGS
jgi:hypothetical protein